jgi:hypothetical protein
MTSMRASALLDAVLPHPVPPERLAVAGHLAEHAQVLARAASRPGRAETVHPSDPRPLAQAAEVARYLAAAGPDAATGRGTPGRDTGVLLEYARSAAAVTVALEATARRQFAARRWLVPAGEDSRSDLVWVATTKQTPEPPLLAALGRAGDHGRGLAAAAAAALPARGPGQAAAAARGMPGTEALTAALAAARAAQGRPSVPSAAVGYRPPAAPPGRSREGRSR